MPALLHTHSLTLAYGSRVILRGVNLALGTGEFWCLLGNNGEGKSTVVKALLGLLTPRQGTMHYGAALADQHQIGYVPQRSDSQAWLPTTVREFVMLGLTGQRLARHIAQERLVAALAAVDLGERAGQAFDTLSGGLRQRALIARALLRQPKLLILDEPTTGLDPGSEAALLACLLRLRAEGLCIFLVTHDLALAMRHASHLALCHQGTVRSRLADEVTPALLSEIFGAKIAWPASEGSPA